MISRQNFNPHEREARDAIATLPSADVPILIHTSVKLVTRGLNHLLSRRVILIHTSVKLVTKRRWPNVEIYEILIHTSVKLVTYVSVKTEVVT